MKRRQVINSVAVVVIALAALRLYFFFNPRPDAIDPRAHEHLGLMLANEAIQALDGGGRLIVIARDGREFQVPAATAQLQSFLEAIKRGGRTVTALRSIQVDPLRPMAVPPGDFFDLLRQAKENDVFVSFMGPPHLSDEQVQKLGAKRSKVFAVCPGEVPRRVNLRHVFEQKLVTVAVVSRPDAPAVVPPGSAQNAFDQTFKVITSDNLGDLNALASTGTKEAAR